ncbi:hypothetical protein Tco_0308253 [Tanacetum coccineum]
MSYSKQELKMEIGYLYVDWMTSAPYKFLLQDRPTPLQVILHLHGNFNTSKLFSRSSEICPESWKGRVLKL